MIFSSINFLIFWLITLYLFKKFSLNNYIYIFIFGLIFYSFQGFVNSLVLFLIVLIIFLYSAIKKYFYFFIFLTLIPLILFKYYLVFDILNIDIPSNLQEFLYKNKIPPGLSFVTFSAVAFICAIKNNEFLKLNFLKISSYIYFFPQLIAGPIVMPSQLIPQILRSPLIKNDNIHLGIFIFSVGFFIKVFLADTLGPYIDPIIADVSDNKIEDIIISIILFSQQIFFDFNGYTLMALGIAKTFSIELPENFNSPYLSTSISDFWRKWHITLSNWLKNFIYIPLGGSKSNNYRTFINILITMVCSGIWHGYGTAFVIWGFSHGVLMVIEKIITFPKIPKFIKIIITYFIITTLWSVFRITNTDDWIVIISKNMTDINYLKIITVFMMCVVINFSQNLLLISNIKKFHNKLNKNISLVLCLFIIIFCLLIVDGSSQKFIYFNF